MRKFTLSAVGALLALGFMAQGAHAASAVPGPSPHQWVYADPNWNSVKVVDATEAKATIDVSNNKFYIDSSDIKALAPNGQSYTTLYIRENRKNLGQKDKPYFSADPNSTITLSHNTFYVNRVAVENLVGFMGRTSAGQVTADGNGLYASGLTIDGNKVVGAEVTGDYNQTTNNVSVQAHGNEVVLLGLNFTGSKATAPAYAAAVSAAYANQVSLEDNTLVIQNATIQEKEISGARIYKLSSTTDEKAPGNQVTVKGNSLAITDSKINKKATLVAVNDADNSTTKTLTSEGNQVLLSHVTLEKSGTYEIGGTKLGKVSSGSVTGNKVTISHTELTPDADITLYGASLPEGTKGVTLSGNELHIEQSTGQIDRIWNFNKIFVSYDYDAGEDVELPDGVQPEPGVKVAADEGQPKPPAEEKPSVSAQGALLKLAEVKNVNSQRADGKPELILSVKGRDVKEGTVLLSTAGSSEDPTKPGGAKPDQSGLGKVTVTVNGLEVMASDNGHYIFSLDKVKPTEHSGVYTTPLAASSQLLAMGTALVIDHPIDGTGPFVTLGGGQNKYAKEGNYLKTNGFTVMGGVALVMNASHAKYTFAPFIEYANGSYESNVQGLAKGDVHYGGVGVLLKLAHDSGAFADASARVGQVASELNTMNGASEMDEHLSSKYVSTHARLGYRVPLSETLGLTPYVRYTYTHVGKTSDSIGTLYSGFTSSMTTAGFSLDGQLGQNLSWKLGAAWEHEFDGKGNASQYGQSLTPWTMKGDSAVMQVQATFVPASFKNVKFDTSVEGRVGDTQGVLGRVGVRYDF